MTGKELFDKFDNGVFSIPGLTVDVGALNWYTHPEFGDLEIKDIVTGALTEGKYSFHLLRLAPNGKIGLHSHETQTEINEVISGYGICVNGGKETDLIPGTITVSPAQVEHKMIAGDAGLLLFAKFFPALN
jgi:mannose-6-phosphate isomerase-like protein (cupin superfamily)